MSFRYYDFKLVLCHEANLLSLLAIKLINNVRLIMKIIFPIFP